MTCVRLSLQLDKYQNRHTLLNKVGRAVWGLVWLCAFRPTPSRIRLFSAWRIFLLRCFGAKIGRGCIVASSVEVWQPWRLQMGNQVALSEKVNCYNVGGVLFGDRVTVSRGAFLCGASHDITSSIMELTFAPIVIEQDAWICAEAFIGLGVTVSQGAVVAARAVVTKDVAPWMVVGGNPAREIKVREVVV